MPDHAELIARLTRLFERRLHVTVAAPDTDLFATGALDSLTFVDLLLEIEREYGLRISLDRIELGAFQTIERIAAFIAAGLDAKSPAAATERRHARAE